VIYDVQENYFRNILFTNVFPVFIRPFIAFYARTKELLCSPFVSHFLLAEKAYAKELSFPSGRFTVLENKLKRPNTLRSINPDKNQLLFSGTLAETTGIFKAIEIAVKLHQIDQNISLVIIGYCAQETILEKIEKFIAPHSFIRLIGGNVLVPHEQILEQIQASGAGIIAYPYNPSTAHSTPTKLFEYLGFKLPIILIHHTPWVEVCESYHAAVVFDPENIATNLILGALKTQQFYDITPDNVFWESEEPKLTALVSSILI
jgi:glycosyltransferase involved in cell wall biosynthesis